MKIYLKCFGAFFVGIYLLTILIPFATQLEFDTIPQNIGVEHEPLVKNYQDKLGENFLLYDVATKNIIEVSEKDFLIGSLVSEMDSSVGLEAMKAQTVAAYSYYSCLRNENADNDYHFTFNSEINSVYTQNIDPSEIEVYQNAVESVYGEILMYQNEIAYASFFNNSNGRTESALDVWGKDLPYLISVASPYDNLASTTQKSYHYSPEEIILRLSTAWGEDKFNFELEYDEWFSNIKRTLGNTVVSVNICGFTVTGEELRQCFSLASPNFSVTYNGEYFEFESMGQGSLVGMSQSGAVYMASEGASYTEILEWYYKDTTLKTVMWKIIHLILFDKRNIT